MGILDRKRLGSGTELSFKESRLIGISRVLDSVIINQIYMFYFYSFYCYYIELNSGYRVLFEDQTETCHDKHRVQGLAFPNYLTKDECLKKCDSNKHCIYASHDSENECSLYSSCHSRKLITRLNTITSVFEKSM